MSELPVIQKMYDFILWYAPHLNRMLRRMQFVLGDRIQGTMYDVLEGLIEARYDPDRLPLLQRLNAKLDVLRHQTRLCRDFDLPDVRRYEFSGKALRAAVGEGAER